MNVSDDRVKCQGQMSWVKCHGQISGSNVRIKCQGQMSGSNIRVKCQDQISGSNVRIKFQGHFSGTKHYLIYIHIGIMSDSFGTWRQILTQNLFYSL